MASQFTSRIWSWSSIGSLLTGVAGLVVTFMILLTSAREQHDKVLEARRSMGLIQFLRNDLQQTEASIKKADAELQESRRRIAALEGQLAVSHPGQVLAPSRAVLQEIGAMKAAQEDLKTRLSQVAEVSHGTSVRIASLESVIISDPQKAVAIPLIQRDVAVLDARLTREIQAAQSDNARVYDLMKWLVGLMALVSLSLIGTAAGSVFKREPKDASTGLESTSSVTKS